MSSPSGTSHSKYPHTFTYFCVWSIEFHEIIGRKLFSGSRAAYVYSRHENRISQLLPNNHEPAAHILNRLPCTDNLSFHGFMIASDVCCSKYVCYCISFSSSTLKFFSLLIHAKYSTTTYLPLARFLQSPGPIVVRNFPDNSWVQARIYDINTSSEKVAEYQYLYTLCSQRPS